MGTFLAIIFSPLWFPLFIVFLPFYLIYICFIPSGKKWFAKCKEEELRKEEDKKIAKEKLLFDAEVEKEMSKMRAEIDAEERRIKVEIEKRKVEVEAKRRAMEEEQRKVNAIKELEAKQAKIHEEAVNRLKEQGYL